MLFFFFSSRRRHTRCSRDWSSDVCSSDSFVPGGPKEMCTSSRGAGTARLRSSKASIKEKTAELEPIPSARVSMRSEEHTSELQSRLHLVCRLLLEKKKKTCDKRTLLAHQLNNE